MVATQLQVGVVFIVYTSLSLPLSTVPDLLGGCGFNCLHLSNNSVVTWVGVVFSVGTCGLGGWVGVV